MREETSVNTKNAMLEYVTEIVENAQDFGWPSAKGAHALLLCRIEEDKFDCSMTDKIDRLRKFMLKKLLPITPSSLRKKVLTLKVSLVISTKLVSSHRRVTTQMDSYISISVAAETALAKGLYTQLRTVEMPNVRTQETSEALQ